VFVIHGFGQDTASDYDVKLRRHIAESYGMVAVTVEYHCYRSRPEIGAQYLFTEEALMVLQGLAQRCGMREEVSLSNLSAVVEAVGSRLAKPWEIRVKLVPPNGDHQNFGVLQSLDHLYVLDHLVRNGPEFDRRRIWLFGSSHGGYLAHLLHKFAPNSFSAIIDNSGYTRANRNYLGAGSEYAVKAGNLTLGCSVASSWQFENVYGPNFFGIGQDLIRQVTYRPHIVESRRAALSACRIRMTNSRADRVSPFALKSKLNDLYREVGIDSILLPFGGDGASPDFAKSGSHADVSLKKLFDHLAPDLMKLPGGEGRLDRDLGTHLSFDCVESTYHVRHGGEHPVHLWIQPAQGE
jgi:hypothetical protein